MPCSHMLSNQWPLAVIIFLLFFLLLFWFHAHHSTLTLFALRWVRIFLRDYRQKAKTPSPPKKTPIQPTWDSGEWRVSLWFLTFVGNRDWKGHCHFCINSVSITIQRNYWAMWLQHGFRDLREDRLEVYTVFRVFRQRPSCRLYTKQAIMGPWRPQQSHRSLHECVFPCGV